MQTFINEASAHGQCRERPAVNRIVASFVQVLDRVTAYQKGDLRWLGPQIVVYQRADVRAECVLLFGAGVGTLISSISDVLIRTRLTDSLGRLRSLMWTADSQQLDDVLYICNGGIEIESSVAEMAERTFREPEVPSFMLNFGGSRYLGSPTLDVAREQPSGLTDLVKLDVVETLDDLEDWAAGKHYIPRPYSLTSPEPPRDDQTILVDRECFQRTNRRQHGRRVFEERATGYFWYICTAHKGAGAHFEVFGADFEHIGKAGLDGVIDRSRRVPGRRIDR